MNYFIDLFTGIAIMYTFSLPTKYSRAKKKMYVFIFLTLRIMTVKIENLM
jgi:hypothetical protein